MSNQRFIALLTIITRIEERNVIRLLYHSFRLWRWHVSQPVSFTPSAFECIIWVLAYNTLNDPIHDTQAPTHIYNQFDNRLVVYVCVGCYVVSNARHVSPASLVIATSWQSHPVSICIIRKKWLHSVYSFLSARFHTSRRPPPLLMMLWRQEMNSKENTQTRRLTTDY